MPLSNGLQFEEVMMAHDGSSSISLNLKAAYDEQKNTSSINIAASPLVVGSARSRSGWRRGAQSLAESLHHARRKQAASLSRDQVTSERREWKRGKGTGPCIHFLGRLERLVLEPRGRQHCGCERKRRERLE